MIQEELRGLTPLSLQGDLRMLATRFKNSTTTENVSTLIALINDPNCEQVILFGSPRSPTPEYSRSDEPETNLPLVAAVAKYSIPKVSEIYVVFDGLFLTAARCPRYYEVRELLDVAEKSSKVFFSAQPVPFTSSKNPETAAQIMIDMNPIVQLSPSTRAQYFALLCLISEDKYPC